MNVTINHGKATLPIATDGTYTIDPMRRVLERFPHLSAFELVNLLEAVVEVARSDFAEAAKIAPFGYDVILNCTGEGVFCPGDMTEWSRNGHSTELVS